MTGVPRYALDSSRGLPTNQIHRLAMDTLSRLWLATPVGLSCFDGSSVRSFDRTRGLRCNGLRSVGASTDGTVWVGTDQGLEVLDEQGNAAMNLPNWPFGLCQHIDASLGSAWIGAAHGIVNAVKLGGSGFRIVFSAEVGFVADVRVLSATRIFAATPEQGLLETDGAGWWPYRCEGLPHRRATRLAVSEDGALLVGTDRGLFVVDDRSRAVVAHLVETGRNPEITAVAAQKTTWWAAFGRSLVAYDTASAHPVDVYELDSPVNDLLPDRLGNLWIGTNNNGLAQISCLRHAVARVDLGRGGGVYSIRSSTGNAFTIGGEDLLVDLRADGKSDAATPGPPGLPSTTVWDGLADESGTWTATQAGLFHAKPGEAFHKFKGADDVLEAPVRALLPRGAEMWVGTLRGLLKIRDGKPTPVNDAFGQSLGYVYALHDDLERRLWVATLGRGLWREERRELRSFAPVPLSAAGNTYAIAQNADGRMAILQDDKVVLLEPGGAARLIAELPPVAGWSALWLDDSTLALGTTDGLRLLDVPRGRVTHQVSCVFSRRDWEFTNTRTLLKDPTGRLLCGVNRGLVRIDLNLLRPFLDPPPCRLSQITWTATEPAREGHAYQVPYGPWSVRVRVFSAWFVDHAQVTYRFQLVGFDRDFGPETDRPETVYTSLPPGRYRLVGQARSPLTGFGVPSELAEIHVLRPWWALGWSSGLQRIGAGYKRVVHGGARNKALIEANRALEAAVQQRTASLNAANAELSRLRNTYQHLSEIDELTGLGNRRRFEAEISRMIALAGRLNIPVALLMMDVDHFKTVNDSHGHHVGDEYLSAIGKVLASTVRRGEDVATRFGGEEFAILLSNTPSEGARVRAERVRSEIQSLKLGNAGAPGGVVTVSIGIAVLLPGHPPDVGALVVRADRALYAAKRGGRNRVMVESQDQP
jgi:diguanylate cyclase (GGDEF)-like protein